MEHILVCLSVSYSCTDPHERLIRAWKDVRNGTNSGVISRNSTDPVVAMTWAVPIELSSSAIVNVVTMKLPRIPVEEISMDLLPNVLNDAFMSKNGAEITKEHSSSRDGILNVD